MILTCPQCSTQFHINPKRIADTGTKVRCSRCKEVFLATKPLPQPPPEPEQEDFTFTEPEHSEPEHSQPEQTETTTRFPPDPVDEEPEMPTDIDDVDFDYDRFQELDADKEFSDTKVDASANNGDDTSEHLEKTKNSAVALDNDAPDENLVPPWSAASDDADDGTETWQEAPKSSPFASLIRILLLLILAILIIAGVMVFMNGPDHLNQILRQYFGQQAPSPPQLTGEMTLGEMDGKFIINEQGSELFLIRGEVTNRFNQAQSAVQVKGILYDQHGKPLAQKTVFCGNPLTDEELRTLPFSELEQRMGNQFGKDLINMNIASGKTIPFAIVFRNLPENVSEFSVAVTASNPADQ